MKHASAQQLVNAALQEVLAKGQKYRSGAASMNSDKPIVEVLNSVLVLKEPLNRESDLLDKGLAAARFFYLLSGSRMLTPINFYTDGVRKFSDDDRTVPDSSYGYKIFGKGQFWKCAQLIREREHTKRAAIAIYESTDCARVSKDIPCLLSIVFEPRDGKLHMTTLMRANDAHKLLAYNIYELTLLQECMATATDLELGEYTHFCCSLHLRDAGIRDAQQYVKNKHKATQPMQQIQMFNKTTHKELISIEKKIRTRIATSKDIDKLYSNTVQKIQEPWKSILHELFILACKRTHRQWTQNNS